MRRSEPRRKAPVRQTEADEPQYLKIRRELLEIVERRRGDGPGAHLFTEHEIAQRFGVHRMTARQAIQGLVSDGIVYQVRGRGTLLAPHKVAEQLDRISNFLEDWPSQGRDTTSRILRFEPDYQGELPAKLELELERPVLFFERLRLVENIPVALDRRFVTLSAASAFTIERLRRKPIQSILAQLPGVRVSGTELEIEAVVASAADAATLGTSPRAPMLMRNVRTLDQNQNVLVGGYSYQRADLFKYRIFLRADVP